MQELIKHVDYNGLTDFITAIEESEHMIIVSDGSGKDFKMIFDWTMSTQMENELQGVQDIPTGDRVLYELKQQVCCQHQSS